MKVTIKNLDLLDKESKERILKSILDSRHINLGWIKWMLGFLRIEGRTRCYAAFQDPYYYNRKHNIMNQDARISWNMSEEQNAERRSAVTEILEQSTLEFWVHQMLKEVTIENAARIIAPYMNNRLEVEIIMEGLRTN